VAAPRSLDNSEDNGPLLDWSFLFRRYHVNTWAHVLNLPGPKVLALDRMTHYSFLGCSLISGDQPCNPGGGRGNVEVDSTVVCITDPMPSIPGVQLPYSFSRTDFEGLNLERERTWIGNSICIYRSIDFQAFYNITISVIVTTTTSGYRRFS
jgi:hypothetical protein